MARRPSPAREEVRHLLRGGVCPDEVASRTGTTRKYVMIVGRDMGLRAPRCPLTIPEALAAVRAANRSLVRRYVGRGLTDTQISSVLEMSVTKVADIRAELSAGNVDLTGESA